ncbi:MAG TPA: phosphatidate cytidylyltransferase [Candidatus Limnocylindrales bacterium]|nr:phosphatidate cytidylyltransferase [Candidatus Limnocylindrales bacterium]
MLQHRLRSAAVLIPLLLVVLVLGQPFLAVLVLGITLLAAREVFALLRQAGYASDPLLGMAFAAAIVIVAWLVRDVAGESAMVVAAGVVLAAVGAMVRRDPREAFQSWLATVFGALYIGLAAFLVRIVEEAPALPPTAPLAAWFADGGRAWLLVAVLGVWAFDSGAYAAGKRFGRRRFMEHISPAKTWAGVIGGLVAATAVCALMLWAVGAPPLQAALLGPLVAFAAQAGDLAESMLKRAAGAKDSGELIPGHGGMLDRVDSLLFAGPAVYFFLLVLGSGA